MANWKKNITLEVKLPYCTQNTCKLRYNTVKIDVDISDVWFSGVSKESRVWKAYVRWGDRPMLIVGKANNTAKHGDVPTTYKVGAWATYDGINVGWEYKAKVVRYE